MRTWFSINRLSLPLKTIPLLVLNDLYRGI